MLSRLARRLPILSRSFASQSSLLEEIGGLPAISTTGVSTVVPSTEVTTLSNGVKVASRDVAGDHTVSVSVCVGSGTRDENLDTLNRGRTYFIMSICQEIPKYA